MQGIAVVQNRDIVGVQKKTLLLLLLMMSHTIVLLLRNTHCCSKQHGCCSQQISAAAQNKYATAAHKQNAVHKQYIVAVQTKSIAHVGVQKEDMAVAQRKTLLLLSLNMALLTKFNNEDVLGWGVFVL